MAAYAGAVPDEAGALDGEAYDEEEVLDVAACGAVVRVGQEVVHAAGDVDQGPASSYVVRSALVHLVRPRRSLENGALLIVC